MQAATILVFLQLLRLSYADQCLSTDQPVSDGVESHSSLPSDTQVIITSYKFLCQGHVTEWWSLIIPSNSSDTSELAYTFKFQVWRPSVSVEGDGCYKLVGENSFVNMSVSDNGIMKATPDNSTFISVLPGDVVGYYIYSTVNGNVSGGGEGSMGEGRTKLDARSANETVWYHSNTKSDPLISGTDSCYFAVGNKENRTLQSFTTAAPIFSLQLVPETSFPSPSPTSSATDTTDMSSSVVLVTGPAAIAPIEGPVTPGNNNWRLIFIVAIIVGILILSCLFCLILIVLLGRRRRRKRKELKEDADELEPIYAEIDMDRRIPTESLASGIEVVLIEVEANESYAMLNSNSLVVCSYGTVLVDPATARARATRT